MKDKAVYLDAQASTPIAPEALAALTERLAAPGNPHSPHVAGAQAYEAIARARATLADLIGASPAEIIFTSGATEANNMAILGFARAAAVASTRRTIVTSAIEHPSVLETVSALRSEGFVHRIAPVGGDGRVDLAALAKLIDADTLLVCVMAANNVVGVIQPVAEVAALARAAGALVHCDAAQAGGRIALDVFDLDVDSLSLSAHKMYGPPGVGALYLSAAAPLRPAPITFGGGQEHGLRPGTAPAALIASFGAAAGLVRAHRQADAGHAEGLAARFVSTLKDLQVRFSQNGSDLHRVPGALSIAVANMDAQELSERISTEVAISTGSACSSGQMTVSPVLVAMGIDGAVARSSVRLCFHRYSTEAEADRAALAFARAVREAALAPGSFVQ